MNDSQAPALAQAGRRLHTEAKEHMRSSRYHRRRAKELYAEVETLAEMCKAHGIIIDFTIPITSPNVQGDASGNADADD